MTQVKKRWLIAILVGGVAALLSVFAIASILATRFDPYIRQQATAYLSKRFESETEIGKLNVNIPRIPFMKLFWSRGRGVIASVTGEDIVMRHKGRRDVPPMFTMKKFRFEVDLGRLFEPSKRVSTVHIEHMEIQIPPKGERPALTNSKSGTGGGFDPSAILIEQVIVVDSLLVVLPKDPSRKPLEFELHRVVLNSVGLNQPLKYRANLTNARPPGVIDANGNFGPWNADAPSETALDGRFTFNNADLSVFQTIEGTLSAQGSFKGSLASVETQGEADVPNFKLRGGGGGMLLHTEYEALVDGTNGDTVLKPVHAKLGSTAFTTSGAILKHEREAQHSIDLDVDMPDGEMMELLKLAVKDKPFMSGRIEMKAKIRIPPLQQAVSKKLILDGRFHIKRGQFLQDVVQGKIDTLSRRGQGQPKNESIDNVFSDMAGDFHLENQNIQFRSLSFGVPGAKVDLAGQYDTAGDALDFKGTLRLDARVSQTMTGWKRWFLKAADPFFAKNGAGTFLKIKVSGSSKDPQFGAAR